MMVSRAYTKEEIREQFLEHIKELIKYWARLPNKSLEDVGEGVAFSILNIFDGTTMNLPAFDITVRPHPDDKGYNVARNENWYKDGTVINDFGDYLHHDLCKGKDNSTAEKKELVSAETIDNLVKQNSDKYTDYIDDTIMPIRLSFKLGKINSDKYIYPEEVFVRAIELALVNTDHAIPVTCSTKLVNNIPIINSDDIIGLIGSYGTTRDGEVLFALTKVDNPLTHLLDCSNVSLDITPMLISSNTVDGVVIVNDMRLGYFSLNQSSISRNT